MATPWLTVAWAVEHMQIRWTVEAHVVAQEREIDMVCLFITAVPRGRCELVCPSCTNERYCVKEGEGEDDMLLPPRGRLGFPLTDVSL